VQRPVRDADGVSAPLERLAARSGGGFPHLLAARERTARELSSARARLGALAIDDDAAVVLFGSWGRQELTPGSDDDWLVLVVGDRRDAIRPASEAVGDVLVREPGRQAVFGEVAFAAELAGRIGLDEDTNRNLTRRMLLLLESVAVAGEPAWRASREHILDGYLRGDVKDHRPPRFFLNDVIRYWRTITVDFVGKERAGGGEKGALRNLKLRLNRKVLFAGGLLPLLLCHRLRAEQIAPELRRQLDQPATDRLAEVFLEFDPDAGVRALAAYDRWLGMLADDAVRAELAALTREQGDTNRAFRQARRYADELQNGLLAVLFEGPLLPLVREYGIF
jgi:predicted nucleotidyltransferase